MRDFKSRIILVVIAIVSGLFAYLKYGRPKVVDWGATPEEKTARLPGDDLVPEAALQTTRVVTIDAPPADIWPWLVQMGPRPRAGVYTYDWIERRLGIDIENSDRILDEFQTLRSGEFFELGDGRSGLRVVRVEPDEALVLRWEPGESSWAFVLRPDGEGHTRLISRNRIPGHGAGFWLGMSFMEPGSLIMERKMLLGIKERAESSTHGLEVVG